jgi:hypothetical protein
MKRIIEIGDTKYWVHLEMENYPDSDAEKLKKHYSKLYNDFFLLKDSRKNNYLFCRKVDEADFVDHRVVISKLMAGIHEIKQTDNI